MTDEDPSPPEDSDSDSDSRLGEEDLLRFDPGLQDALPDEKNLLAKQARDEHRRLLELQLRKLRSEASAARLEAKAAEIELMIRRLSEPFSLSETEIREAEFPDPKIPDPRISELGAGDNENTPGLNPLAQDDGPATRPSDEERSTDKLRYDEASKEVPLGNFQSWSDVRDAMRLRVDRPHGEFARETKATKTWHRPDGPHSVPGHHFEAAEPVSDQPDGSHPNRSSTHPSSEAFDTKPSSNSYAATNDDTVDAALNVDASSIAPLAEASLVNLFDSSDGDGERGSPLTEDLQIESDLEDEQGSPSRPGAWLVSALAHVAILILLAAVGLSQHRPKDQVALTASAPATEQVSMETFEIETSEPQTEPQPSEPNPADVQYELSPVGEISASEMISDAPPAPPSSSMAAMLSRSNSASLSMSMKPNSDATMEFCGVKGGGNHFVYLVDSSGSMGDAFDSARAELLRSIDLLKPEQRFYVIFFDAESDYMRLSDANTDETRSVHANRVNKDALKRWAMRIRKDRGRAPYDALRFALKLKPDVIFLLSDGEFPQGIEDLLRDENKINNLFGDDDPISIVHTIGYHSKEGESRMKRIAEQNQGMYRHVPKP